MFHYNITFIDCVTATTKQYTILHEKKLKNGDMIFTNNSRKFTKMKES